MNILGISGAIGWDGNLQQIMFRDELVNIRIHGSGATLFMDGHLKHALHEERFSRIKNDGNYPKLSIEKLLVLTVSSFSVSILVSSCVSFFQKKNLSSPLSKFFGIQGASI